MNERISPITAEEIYLASRGLPVQVKEDGIHDPIIRIDLSKLPVPEIEQLLNDKKIITALTSRGVNVLDMYDTGAIRFPDSICQLTSLGMICLFNNRFEEIPEEIGNLSNLWFIDLSYNQLHHLPESIGKLTKLDILYLAKNRLTALPDSFGNLINLSSLDVQDNCLTSLPASWGNFPKMTHIDLRGNPSISLPKWIKKLPKLEEVKIDKRRRRPPKKGKRLIKLTELPVYQPGELFAEENLSNTDFLNNGKGLTT